MPSTRLFRSGTLKSIDGVVKLATAVPDAPTGLSFTAAGGQGQTTWNLPTQVHGSPVHRQHAVLTGAGAGTFDIKLPRLQTSLAFGGLTDGVTYSFSISFVNGFGGEGESTAATATATPAAPDIFDIRTWDPGGANAADVGPSITPATVLTGEQQLSLGTGNLTNLSSAHVDTANSSWVRVVADSNHALADNNLDCPLIYDPGDSLAHTLSAARLVVKPTLQQQHNRGARTGAISGLKGTLTNAEIQGPADGIQGPGSAANSATIGPYIWLHGPTIGYYDGITIQSNGAGGWTTTGVVMTEAQTLSVQKYAPGLAVNAGDFIQAAPGGGGAICYQILQTGTLESTPVHTDLAWTRTPFYKGSSTFTSGTALLGCVGPHFHTDGIQFSGGGWTLINRASVTGFSNSAILGQSSNSAATHPVWGVHSIGQSLYGAGVGYWFYIMGQAPAESDGSGAGGYTRDPGTGVWTAHSPIGKTRPWSFAFKDDYLDTSSDGREPDLDCLNVISGSKLMVASETIWRAKVANQYPGITTAQLDALWWPAGIADPATIGLPAVDTSVLEARFQAGVHIGECDMRGAVVMDNVRRKSDDALIHSPKTGAVFDSNGFYVGT